MEGVTTNATTVEEDVMVMPVEVYRFFFEVYYALLKQTQQHALQPPHKKTVDPLGSDAVLNATRAAYQALGGQGSLPSPRQRSFVSMLLDIFTQLDVEFTLLWELDVGIEQLLRGTIGSWIRWLHVTSCGTLNGMQSQLDAD